jgi:hypothetical protein
MKAKEALAKIEFYELEATKVYDFRISPCNEGHSMTYLEIFKGSVQELFARCDEIVSGLRAIFQF